MTKQFVLTDEDAQQVRAIMLSYAEMSDQNAIRSEQLLGRFKRDEPGETLTIDDLQEQVTDFVQDTENLKRIADIFQ